MKFCILQIPDSGLGVILLLSELVHIARHRIQMSASTEMARQKVLHQHWVENTKTVRRIHELRREIEEDQLKVSKVATVKRDDVERYEFEKRRLRHKNSMILNRLM